MSILEESLRCGVLSRKSFAAAEWGTWDRVTPGSSLLNSLKTVLRLRWEDGRSAEDQASALASEELSRTDSEWLVRALLGDLSAAKYVNQHGLFSLANVVLLLAAVVREEGMSGEEIAFLLSAGEEVAREVVTAGDPLMPARRGVDVGPWDVGEVDGVLVRSGRIDLGGLLIPREDGVRASLNRAGGVVGGVTLLKGATGLQLQAFRSDGSRPWDVVRAEMRVTIRRQGGEAEDWAGEAGVELRATVPVTTPSGGWGVQTIRMVGCDGPGWLLRGVVTGEGAQPESRSSWAYEVFRRTVVDATAPAGEGGPVIELREVG